MAVLACWHGYLLGATGSNVYSVNLVEAWVSAGHHVLLFCQERELAARGHLHELVEIRDGECTARHDLVPDGAAARVARGVGACTVIRTDVHGLLPVYVLDRYEGFEARRFVDLDETEFMRYQVDIAGAMAWAVREYAIDGVLINHAVPAPGALRQVLAGAGVPYVVKVHGSDLEYCIAEDARFVGPARHGIMGAASILVGSAHIAARTAELLGDDAVAGRTRTVPPGVDLELFRPLAGGSARAASTSSRQAAATALAAALDQRRLAQPGGFGISQRDQVRSVVEEGGHGTGLVPRLALLHGSYAERSVDPGAADAIRSARLDEARTIAFIGKLIPQKGSQLLVAALPLLLEAHGDLQLVVAGFGPLREGLEALIWALGTSDVSSARALASTMGDLAGAGGTEPSVDRHGSLPQLVSFFDALMADPSALAAYEEAAASLHERIIFLGLVDHEVLRHVWPLCEVSVVPSLLAEAFGMVAAEAAACGCLPMVADHSGLADVADAIAERYAACAMPGDARSLVGVPLGDEGSVVRLARALDHVLGLDAEAAVGAALAARRTVEEEWSWPAIAQRSIAAMQRPAVAGDGARVAQMHAPPEPSA